jgi:hypothetical protein
MRYKIYTLRDDPRNKSVIYTLEYPISLIEASFNWPLDCSSIEIAEMMITSEGVKGTTYTILPYIYKGE